MSNIAIMQPSFLPWPGYFNLILNSDYFVFLNSVKIEKSSWQTRNLFMINNRPQYLTVPIMGSRLQIIKDVLVDPKINWREKHMKTLTQNYYNHPFGTEVLDILIPIYNNNKIKSLSDFNIELIKQICNYLKISTNFEYSSNYNFIGNKSQRLIDIFNHFKSNVYLSPQGSKTYIDKEGIFDLNRINVKYQINKNNDYIQINSNKFIPNLSILDLMFNIGPNKSLKYIENNY